MRANAGGREKFLLSCGASAVHEDIKKLQSQQTKSKKHEKTLTLCLGGGVLLTVEFIRVLLSNIAETKGVGGGSVTK